MNAARPIPLLGALAALIFSVGCAAATPTNETGPHGVVLFIGDGMGVSTVTAARILAGQQAGASGEEHSLSFEAFPNVALIKTYTTDFQVPDSAGTMTAIVTGEKTRSGVLSVAASVPRGDCEAALDAPLVTLLERAEQAGFATGLVSTATITHATPAANYAHVPDRNWEDDSQMPAAALDAGCRDIARQLVEFPHGDGVDVILGGGRSHFLPKTEVDPEYPDKQGNRADGQNLAERWLEGAEQRTYVWNDEQFRALQTGEQEGQVLGLFEPSHMQFEADRAADGAGEPELKEMTRFAVQALTRDTSRPFLLVVEAGRIDHGHHFNNAHRALTDTLALHRAVAVADELLPEDRALLLVTADHSHVFTIAGYPRRGNPILGLAEAMPGQPLLDTEGRPYTTLGYGNGPSYRSDLPDLSEVDTAARDYQQAATVPLRAETHAGEDVAAYARGPGADRVRGVMEQNALYDALRFALFGE